MKQDESARRDPGRVVALVERVAAQKSNRVAVLGLAYEPDTNVVEESQGVAIAKGLAEKGYNVAVFDPAATEPAKRLLGDTVCYSTDLVERIRDAVVIVLATDWPEFRSLLHQTSSCVPRPVIIDGWRLLRQSSILPDEMSYRAVGIGHPDPSVRERFQRFLKGLAGKSLGSEKEQRMWKAESAGD